MNNDKAVLIIGNGFDLALKRKTQYSNFYNSKYCPKWYPAPLIAYLNNWTEKKESTSIRWMDLENAIQDYAKDRGKDKPFPVHYTEEEFALIKKLYDYDITPNQNNHYKFSENETKLLERIKGKHKIVFEKPTDSYITFPNVISDMEDFNAYQNSIKEYESLRSLDDEESKSKRSELLKQFKERDRKALNEIEENLAQYLREKVDCSVLDKENNLAYELLERFWRTYPEGKIYSFNYTSLDALIEEIERKPAQYSKYRIKYMHGSLDKGHVILGAGTEKDDITYGEWDFLKKSNDNQYTPPELVRDMKEAEHIYIYGHSLNDIDIQYFKYLFNDMQKKEETKEIKIYSLDVQRIKNNINKISNIDDLQMLGINVIDCEEKGPNILDDYLPHKPYIGPQNVL